MKGGLTIYLSVSVLLNAILFCAVIHQADKRITEKELMSFCMKHKVADKDCKIPYQYKRVK